MIKLLLKQLMPLIKENVESGKIDAILQQLCADVEAETCMEDGSTIELMLSNESADNQQFYVVSFVELMVDNRVRPVKSFRLSEVIQLILSKI
jgi:hypothetical protein